VYTHPDPYYVQPSEPYRNPKPETYFAEVSTKEVPSNTVKDTPPAVRINVPETDTSTKRRKTPLEKQTLRKIAATKQATWEPPQKLPWPETIPQNTDLLESLTGYHLESGYNSIPDIKFELDRKLPHYQNFIHDNEDHETYISDPESCVILSIDINGAEAKEGKKSYRAILRTQKGDTRLLVECRKKDRIKTVKEQFPQYLSNDIKLQLIKSKDIHKDLLEFDRNYYKGKYKFGVLYAKPGQVNEIEFF